jgi:hypothetical protein
VNSGLATRQWHVEVRFKGNSAQVVFRLGAMLISFDTSVLNFASILSTENNTAITISKHLLTVVLLAMYSMWAHFNNVK